MQLITKKIDDMELATYNPRITLKPDMEEYENLKKSILLHGFVTPAVWNLRTNVVVSGHQRIQVAKDLGMDEIPVSVVDLPEEKEKALNIALNKISGEWEPEKLYDLLQEIGNENFQDAGFSDADIKRIELDIANYIDEELLQRDKSQTTALFTFTLTFPADKKHILLEHVKTYGKDDIVQLLTKMIMEDE